MYRADPYEQLSGNERTLDVLGALLLFGLCLPPSLRVNVPLALTVARILLTAALTIAMLVFRRRRPLEFFAVAVVGWVVGSFGTLAMPFAAYALGRWGREDRRTAIVFGVGCGLCVSPWRWWGGAPLSEWVLNVVLLVVMPLLVGVLRRRRDAAGRAPAPDLTIALPPYRPPESYGPPQ